MLTHTAIRTAYNRAANNPSPRAPVPGGSIAASIDLMGATMPYGRDSEIYGEGEPADYLYKVVTGAVRTYKVLADGRRQLGPSTCRATSLGSRRATIIRSRRKQSPMQKF